ncbi:hypothetical protein BP00DRAFT_219392 [Aspergillus indologenus CBS 114.80]|uniref:Protein kinase domain-containing protein n=1 Tax=Aspergillus indologenus CBS 114.80 TaxID=1450541 RepID=A0A2V5INA6_9EURO|nr:hypothetical protein BP00DRAFT_219392 [Aspergillus indologenus CBS 114.80]
MTAIALSEISFIEQLRSSSVSCIFHVLWRDKQCILKVYHATEPSPSDPPNRVIDPFTCESTAFTRLQKSGICDLGYVPEFYGIVTRIQPADYLPYLKDFLEDSLDPNAVLLEHIPDMGSVTLSNLSEVRIHKLRHILSEIHRIGIYHGDPYPRNMMIQEASGRVLWIDFDRAQTFTPEALKPVHFNWLEQESEMMDYFVKALVTLQYTGILLLALY